MFYKLPVFSKISTMNIVHFYNAFDDKKEKLLLLISLRGDQSFICPSCFSFNNLSLLHSMKVFFKIIRQVI